MPNFISEALNKDKLMDTPSGGFLLLAFFRQIFHVLATCR